MLRSFILKICAVYLNNIIVAGKSFEEHVKVEECFHEATELPFQHQVNFLGHFDSSKGVAIDTEKNMAVQPEIKDDARSSLELCIYYSRHQLF